MPKSGHVRCRLHNKQQLQCPGSGGWNPEPKTNPIFTNTFGVMIITCVRLYMQAGRGKQLKREGGSIGQVDVSPSDHNGRGGHAIVGCLIVSTVGFQGCNVPLQRALEKGTLRKY
jgi:hypothetical protein